MRVWEALDLYASFYDQPAGCSCLAARAGS
jgi:hypothetical protein